MPNEIVSAKVSIFAIGEGDFNKDEVDKEKDGYDIYAFGH